MDHAGFNLVRDLDGAVSVVGEHRATQALVGVVGQLHGLRLGGNLVDLRHRAEELLVVDVGAHRQIGQNRRGVVRGGVVHLAAGAQGRALGDGALDLVVQGLRGLAGRHGKVLVLARVGRVALGVALGDGHHLVHELVVDVIHDDDALVGGAGLAGVVDALVPCFLGGGAHVGRVEDDVRVGAAELEHNLLQVLARGLRDLLASALGAGEGDTLDARVGDDRLDLIVGGVDVDVHAVGKARVLEHLLECGGGLRRDLGVLENDAIAVHQVRAGEACDLVDRVVPRHDAQERAQRQAADHGLAARHVDLLVCGMLRGVVRVELQDVAGEVHLPLTLRDGLTHLLCRDLRQLGGALL